MKIAVPNQILMDGRPITPAMRQWMEMIARLSADTAAFTAGATSVADGGTITHSLGTTPSRVHVTLTTSGEMAAVTAVGATTFTVAIKKHDNTAGTTQTVYWRAEQ